MEILGKVLSEKTQELYEELTKELVYPVTIVKMNPESPEDCSRPVAMDTGKGAFIVKVDSGLSDELFENALVRDLIYCRQMSRQAPTLIAVSEHDLDARQTAMMVSSVIMDIDVENTLKAHDMHMDDIDTMRLSDLFAFLKAGMSEYNRELYHILVALQITLLLFTTSRRKNIEDIIETFYLSDPEAMDMIDKFVSIIEKYGVADNRSMMRCMRKIGLACHMKGRLNLEYDGKITAL
ncbi:MAG: hypothetical protein Q4D60_03180 [Eubacteriales bacterium]|nr:hypothetical protein [Eubacteriales bacterium]